MPRILVVEDYTNLQLLYGTALNAEGFTVDQAKDGTEALAMAAANEPDLILLDLLMPNEGGLEFLRKYDAKKHPKVKIVVFSNMASPELAAEANSLGASQYLLKSSYTPKEMVDAITVALKK